MSTSSLTKKVACSGRAQLLTFIYFISYKNDWNVLERRSHCQYIQHHLYGQTGKKKTKLAIK